MTKSCKKVNMKWTSHLAQGWTRIAGAQQLYENDIILLKSIAKTSEKELANLF